jgi:hypothetical protein
LFEVYIYLSSDMNKQVKNRLSPTKMFFNIYKEFMIFIPSLTKSSRYFDPEVEPDRFFVSDPGRSDGF